MVRIDRDGPCPKTVDQQLPNTVMQDTEGLVSEKNRKSLEVIY
jgi:hypothetical protein